MAVFGSRQWRRRVSCVALAAVVASVGSTGSAEPPQLRAKRAQAAEVLREISVLDERLSVLSEHYDGARLHLQTVQTRLSLERVALVRARKQYKRAETRVARLLVSLYTDGAPSGLDAILGARSVAEMLAVADAQAAIARERSEIATTALTARQRLHAAVAALQTDRADAARSVAELAQTQQTVEHGLAQRQHLLASVKGEIAQLQARERLREQRLLAAARARLAAAAAARAARERAAAAAQAAAHARAETNAAAHRIAAQTTGYPFTATETETTATTPTSPAQPQPQSASNPTTTASATPPPTSTEPLPTDTTPTATQAAPPPPPSPASAGHTQAAQIALGYVGVPYLWGGATPAGFDCSGLVSYVYAQLGIQLPHYAAAQFGYGSPVTRDQLQPGDLVFFDNLAHVGIYIGADQFVDAPHTGTLVRIDSLDDAWYARHYVGARRI